jgi:DnaJ-class molecular chaperone
MVKDYYIILGLETDATPDDIKSAYHRRALALHPDLSGAASEPFLALQEAYSILSDPRRRREYDLESHAPHVSPARPASPAEPMRTRRGVGEPFRAEAPRRYLGSARLTEDFETYSPSLEDIFERIWSNYVPAAHPKGERMRSLTVELPISAEQAFHGGVVRLQVPALVPCPTCGGCGSVGFFECLRCGGQGQLVSSRGVAVAFPAGLTSDYVTQVPLQQLGIQNLYLTVRFRVSEVMV